MNAVIGVACPALGNQAANISYQAENCSDPTKKWFISILSSQRQGRGCLPYLLGLNSLDFVLMVQHYFSHDHDMFVLAYARNQSALQRGRLRQQLLDIRSDEWYELRNLLRQHRCGNQAYELQLADIVAAGCLGGDHLWRDLGLDSRTELSELMRHNFPELAALNNRDMKWKKFFYKQLCEQQGGYVCRSPSCDQCVAYDDCFGAEE